MDNENKKREKFSLNKNIFECKELFTSRLEHNGVKKKPKKRPKRLESSREVLKYFISHSSLHGIKYAQDQQLYKIERVVWLLILFGAFYCALRVILQLYGNFQAKQTNVIIDEINYDIFHIPFPSVTLCPGTRVDWNEVTKLASALIPETNKEATYIFFELLRNMSKLKFTHLHELHVNANDSVLELLNSINITDVLLQTMPKCEVFISDCSWSYADASCCDIFEIQRTAFGFCYTFNSLISEDTKLKEARKTHAYGIRSGLKLVLNNDNLNYPPGTRDNKSAIFMIHHPKVFPTKARFIAFGSQYNVDIKFTSAFASDDVLELENTDNPPCKHDNGTYKFENCLGICQLRYIQRMCGCNPTFFYPIIDDVRECNITDLQCIAKESEQISEVQFLMEGDELHFVKSMCKCPTECDYCNYDDFVIGLPYHDNSNSIMLDVHYDGPTGVRYKRDIVVSNLDMLVQLGGIFGLFLGGSLLTVIEFIYCFIIGLILYIYKHRFSERKSTNLIAMQQTIYRINTSLYNDSKIYPLLDYPVMFKHNNNNNNNNINNKNHRY